MNLTRLVDIASFEPERVEPPNSWCGHLHFAAWIVQSLNPKVFVELGTHSGNSYLAFCQAVKQFGLETKCYAVDTWLGDEQAGFYNEEVFSSLNDYHQNHYSGFSRLLRMTFDEALPLFDNKSIDLLHIDGLHTYEAVKHDFEAWLPKLAQGAIVLFHDTNVYKLGFGVWKFWSELKERYPTNLDFFHSYGLGILQINQGDILNQHNWLESSSTTKELLRRYFTSLGNYQIKSYELEDLRNQEDQLKLHIISLNQAITNRDGQIASLDQAVADRDGKIASLYQAAADRDGKIASLYQAAADRDGKIASLYQAAADRDGRIAILDWAVADRDGKVETIKQTLADTDRQLASINFKLRRIQAPLRIAKRFIESALRPQKAYRLARDIRIIKKSNLFDIGYYISKYRDVQISTCNPIRHYCESGWKEGRNPSDLFNTKNYLLHNPDVENAGINPFVHYITHGYCEGRSSTIELSYNQDRQISHLDTLEISTDSDQLSPPLTLYCNEPYHEKDVDNLGFPYVDEPQVSIIIPVFNNWKYTFFCLKALQANSGNSISYEVIIADDCSTDETPTMLPRIKGVMIIRNIDNLGFLKNCNSAASRARGRYLIFLNNDTEVQNGWLEALASVFDRFERVGIVGGKLVYLNGQLQEAGTVILQNGWGLAYGRLAEATAYEYNYIKEVDCIIGACFMIENNLFLSLGGFDERYAPAQYEEFDLDFSVRAAGFKVMYQPKAVIVHHESVSSGEHFRNQQSAINQAKFFLKWHHVLYSHAESERDLFIERDRSQCRNHMLVIHGRRMNNHKKECSVSTIEQYLLLFVELGFKVIFLTDNCRAMQPNIVHVQQLGVEVIYGKFNFIDWIKQTGKWIDYVWLTQSDLALNYANEVRNHTNAKLIYYSHELHSLREFRRYELEENHAVLLEFNRLENIEKRLLNSVDVILTPNQEEEAIIREFAPMQQIAILPEFCYDLEHINQKVIPNSSQREEILLTLQKLFFLDKWRDSVKSIQLRRKLFQKVIAHRKSVDIIVCVHNALDDVQRCLDSIVINTDPPYRIIIVDDGSDPTTRLYLESFIHGHLAILIRNDVATGYTRAANKGLNASTADFVILLNSDTIVSKQWLDRLIQCAESDERIGIVGPLSNTASWQSVPEITNEKGDWADNPLEEGWTVDNYANEVAIVSSSIYPRVGFINGFCLLIKSELIRQIGRFDEEYFARGYGEENDYCLRAVKYGWQLAIADDTYVFHAQSKSYSHERRIELCRLAGENLVAKHGQEWIDAQLAITRDHPALAYMRKQCEQIVKLKHIKDQSKRLFKGKSVLFLLPITTTGGGGNIVILEALAMRNVGVDAWIANLSTNKVLFQQFHPNLSIPVVYLDSPSGLYDTAKKFDAIIATYYTTVFWMQPLLQLELPPVLGYYIQDFEPDFFEQGTTSYKQALASYTLINNIRLFTKTQWNRTILETKLGISPEVIGPSVDNKSHHPSPVAVATQNIVRIIAMIRPISPYRGAEMTLRVLRRLQDEFFERVQITIFGVDSDDPGYLLINNGYSPHCLGRLTNDQVAEAMNQNDIFIDCSRFQAMGLTAMEAMACGVAVVGPVHGGLKEIITNGHSGLLVDTLNEDEVFSAVCRLVTNNDLRNLLKKNGLEVVKYSPYISALNILKYIFAT